MFLNLKKQMPNSMPLLLFLLTVFSRLPFTSKYLYHMDSGHFALALDNYDLVLHQPHPPGYFLYVMLGKLVHQFVSDANTTFVLISILFSGLTVVTLYHLGKEMFDVRIGTIAAFLALTSPNFWFHGEVALTYPVEAFFSAIVGLFCWRALKGRKQYVWISAVLLAVAGGFRQNTVVFLFPMWLFSVRKESLRTVSIGGALLFFTSLAWFLSMVIMTGGLDAYVAAFRELWIFSTGHNSVLEKGLPHLKLFSQTLYNFIFFTMGAVLPVVILVFYVLIRNKKFALLKNSITTFLMCWILPSFLFYLLIFIHPANPGYVLILMPPFMLISSVALSYLVGELKKLTDRSLLPALLSLIVIVNSCLFLFSRYPVSRFEIESNDRNLEALFGSLRHFNADTTVILIDRPYIFCSFRHIMIYLPEYTLYMVDVLTNASGETRKFFGGKQGRTILVSNIAVPNQITNFAALYGDDSGTISSIPPGLNIYKTGNNLKIVSGPISRAVDLFPQLRPYWGAVKTDPFQQPVQNFKSEQGRGMRGTAVKGKPRGT